MIGQSFLKNQFSTLMSSNNFPHFSILCGPKGSGKKTLCMELQSMSAFAGIDVFYELPDVKVDTLRTMIEDAYTTKDSMFIIIPDADTMSVNAKNSILKVVEEPPKNVYIIMLLQDLSNTLETIKSRARTFYMDKYELHELKSYSESLGSSSDIPTAVCENPYEIKTLIDYDVEQFYDYVQLVVDNIAEVEPANAFKSSCKLALKTDEGYDLNLFFKTFIYICYLRMEDEFKKYGDAIAITSKYLQKLKKVGVSKTQMYDMWVLEIRGAWLWT